MTNAQRKARAEKRFRKECAIPAELRAEFVCYKYRHELEKLRDCTIKGSLQHQGEHGYIPKPKRTNVVPTLSKSSALSYLRSTGVLQFDTVKCTRHILFGGSVVGKIGNDVMTALLAEHAHEWQRIPGTNKVEYKFKK